MPITSTSIPVQQGPHGNTETSPDKDKPDTTTFTSTTSALGPGEYDDEDYQVFSGNKSLTPSNSSAPPYPGTTTASGDYSKQVYTELPPTANSTASSYPETTTPSNSSPSAPYPETTTASNNYPTITPSNSTPNTNSSPTPHQEPTTQSKAQNFMTTQVTFALKSYKDCHKHCDVTILRDKCVRFQSDSE